MKILISNDDGIQAPGIQMLAKYLAPIADLFIVAPDKERSAVSHAITLNEPIHSRKYYLNKKFFGYAVSGTPVDCVKIALHSLMDSPPDMVISGINQGANLGVDILYSGTISAATEGALLDIPSIAVSVNSYESDAHFESAAKALVKIVDLVVNSSMPNGTLLNVNVPNLPYDQIEGFRITSQGKSKYDEKYIRRTDPRGNDYFWLNGELIMEEESECADHRAIGDNMVSICPIRYEFTDRQFMNSIKDHFEGTLNS